MATDRTHFKTKLFDDGMFFVGFDYFDKSVNVLDEDVMRQFEEIRANFDSNSSAKAMILASLKRGNFIAGADVEKLAHVRSESDRIALEELLTEAHLTLHRMEKSKKPIIAAIEGACMGGGLEIALACHARIASTDEKTVFALPEVKLGIIPGFGGTQRLPRLVGLGQALLMMITGKSIYPRAALKMGIVDDLVDSVSSDERTIDGITREKLLRVATERATSILRNGMPKRKQRLFSAPLIGSIYKNIVCAFAKSKVRKEKGNAYPAPYAVISAVNMGIRQPVVRGSLDVERGQFMECVRSRTSTYLIDLYLVSEELKRKARAFAGDAPARVGIVGAGLMGTQIANILVGHGISVVLADVAPEPLSKAMRMISHEQTQLLKKRVITPSEYSKRMMRVYPTTDPDVLSGVPFIIEAATESLKLKKDILQRMPVSAVFATNTSSLRVADIATGDSMPERCVGLHFFNPVDKMPLVEIVRSEKTSDQAMRMTSAIALAMGKTPIVVPDTPGFLINRLLVRYMAEAVLLVEEGVPIRTIDGAMKTFGMPMGPLELIDFVGFSVAHEVVKTLNEAFGDRFPYPGLIKTMKDTELIEKMKGVGAPRFWIEKNRENKLVWELMSKSRVRFPNYSLKEMQERMLLPMVDEALRCLDERIVGNESELDCAVILGAGFPPFRGGLLKWAHAEYENEHGIRTKLFELVRMHGGRFRSFDPLARAIEVK